MNLEGYSHRGYEMDTPTADGEVAWGPLDNVHMEAVKFFLVGQESDVLYYLNTCLCEGCQQWITFFTRNCIMLHMCVVCNNIANSLGHHLHNLYIWNININFVTAFSVRGAYYSKLFQSLWCETWWLPNIHCTLLGCLWNGLTLKADILLSSISMSIHKQFLTTGRRTHTNRVF